MSVLISNTRTAADGFYQAAGYKPGDRVGNDCLCYGNIWSPNCCAKIHRRTAPVAYAAEGFYNAAGTDAAQKNISDATNNLTVAKKNLADALRQQATTEGEIVSAKARVSDCQAARDAARGGNAKNRACGDLQARFDHWGRLSARLSTEKGKVEGAKLAVAEATDALAKAKEAAEAAKNADPTYAIQQQQIVAQTNKDQAELNAKIAGDMRKSNIIKFSVIGGLVLGAAALGFYFMSKKRKGAKGVVAPAMAAAA